MKIPPGGSLGESMSIRACGLEPKVFTSSLPVSARSSIKKKKQVGFSVQPHLISDTT